MLEHSAKFKERRADRDGAGSLICAVKRNDFDGAFRLLANGANPNLADANGETPLHHAVMAGYTRITKMLLCVGADPNKQNKYGKSVYVLEHSNNEVAELLSRARAWDNYGVICSETRVDDGDNQIATELDRKQQECSVKNQIDKSPAQKARSLRLLSLDGGGIRGIVLIMMLMELEKLIDGECEHDRKKNFVQRHFDWIAGTSTGAILALALADGTPLIECLRLYLRLKDDIFGPAAKLLVGYDSERIEEFLRQQFGERKMSELKCGKMKVFVTATKADRMPLELVLFRSYPSPLANPLNQPHEVPIWRAARCSSAAPTYFPSIDGFVDGGVMANNPSQALLREVYRHGKANESSGGHSASDKSDEIAFLLSLGTGKIPKVQVDSTKLMIEPALPSLVQTMNIPTNLNSMLIEQVTCSDGEVVEDARMSCHKDKVPYFRLTPQLHMDIPLDVTDNAIIVDMMWEAKVHIREHCAQALQTLIPMLREFERANNAEI